MAVRLRGFRKGIRNLAGQGRPARVGNDKQSFHNPAPAAVPQTLVISTLAMRRRGRNLGRAGAG